MADGKIVIDVILDDGTVAKGVTDLNKKLGGVGKAGRTAAIGIGKIVSALGLVALGAKAIDMVRDALDGAISRYDTLQNFPRVLQLMGFDATDAEKAINRLSDGIDGLPTTLDSVASTTQRIALMTGDLDGAVETTLALNNAFLASGSSVADAQRGLEQFVQMLATGTVDMQSWRTLQETMPIALSKVAEAFGYTGKSAQNDLYEALKAGEVTFDEFNAKLIELSDAQGGFADMAKESTGGIATSWQNFKTAIVKGVADVIGAIDDALSSFGGISGIFDKMKGGVSSFFSFVSSNIPVVIGLIGSVIDTIKEWLPPVSEVKDGFITAFQNIYDFVTPIVQEIVSFIMSIWGNLVTWWQANGQQIMQAVQNAFQFILDVVNFIMPAVKFVIEIVWSAIKDIISGALSVIQGLIQVFTGIFTGDFSQLWEGIKKIFSGAIKVIIGWMSLSFLGGIRKILANLLKNGVNIIKNMWQSIVNFFKNFGSTVTNTVSNLVMRIVNFFVNLFNQARNIFTRLRTFGASIWNSLREAVLGVVRNLVSGVRSRFNNMFSVVRNLTHNIRSTITSIWNRILSFLRGINLRSIGRNIIQGLINGIGSMASAVIDKVKGIGRSITNGLKSVLGIASPSKIMRDEIGKWLLPGIVEGAEKTLNQAQSRFGKMAEELTKGVQAGFGIENRLRGARLSLDNLVPAASFADTYASRLAGSQTIDNKVFVEPGDIYMDGRKVGELLDGEQARRTGFYGRRVAY